MMIAIGLKNLHFHFYDGLQETLQKTSNYKIVQVAKACFYWLASMLTYPSYFLGKIIAFCFKPKTLLEKSTVQIEEEYAEIIREYPQLNPQKNPTLFKGGIAAKNKNRYNDILPNESTRFFIPKEPKFYYNGNWILGKSAIACQGPTQNTEADFWNMVWNSSADIIIMVTDLKEGKVQKCHPYWPENVDESITYSNEIFVETISEKTEQIHEKHEMKIRQLALEKRGVRRDIVQLQLCNWIDYHLVTSEVLKRYIERILKTKTTQAPITVHCSAGVGRTGTVMAALEAIQRIEQGDRDPDLIAKIVKDLRKSRNGMVQTLQQYKLIYDVVKLWMCSR